MSNTTEGTGDPIVDKFREMKRIRQEGTPEERADLERRAKIAARAVLTAKESHEQHHRGRR